MHNFIFYLFLFIFFGKFCTSSRIFFYRCYYPYWLRDFLSPVCRIILFGPSGLFLFFLKHQRRQAWFITDPPTTSFPTMPGKKKVCQMSHVTCQKCQLPSSYTLGVKCLEDIFTKDDLMNNLMSNKAVVEQPLLHQVCYERCKLVFNQLKLFHYIEQNATLLNTKTTFLNLPRIINHIYQGWRVTLLVVFSYWLAKLVE